jgi:hypothetical protein
MVGTAAAQDSGVILEVHGGIGLPTFDFSDEEVGPIVGGGIWYTPIDARWALGAEADFGFHDHINVFHFIGKAGYIVHASQGGGFDVMLNLGAGVMMFNQEKVDLGQFGTIDPDAKTYFAVNAGAKFMYVVSHRVNIVFSVQGDVAFSDEDAFGIGTNNAWVWPLSGGVQIKV